MKKIEFKTIKGDFVLVDNRGRANYYDVISDFIMRGVNLKYINQIKDITEKQASNIVDNPTSDGFYPRYWNFEDGNTMWYCLKDNALESLHSLLKSKGVYLYENPNDNQCGTIEWQEAEQNTFYNPYLFKKI